MDSRFMSAAFSATSTERNTVISRMKLRPMTPTNSSGIREPIWSPMSMNAAFPPATSACVFVPFTSGGSTSSRRSWTSCFVPGSWGEVEG